ncbi:hypothetical protein KIPB_007031, partial [Kipferlia bialata]
VPSLDRVGTETEREREREERDDDIIEVKIEEPVVPLEGAGLSPDIDSVVHPIITDMARGRERERECVESLKRQAEVEVGLRKSLHNESERTQQLESDLAECKELLADTDRGEREAEDIAAKATRMVRERTETFNKAFTKQKGSIERLRDANGNLQRRLATRDATILKLGDTVADLRASLQAAERREREAVRALERDRDERRRAEEEREREREEEKRKAASARLRQKRTKSVKNMLSGGT